MTPKGQDSLNYPLEMFMNIVSAGVSSAVPEATPAVRPRAVRKDVAWIAHFSCCAARSLATGIGNGSSPGTTLSLGKGNKRAQVPGHLVGKQQ